MWEYIGFIVVVVVYFADMKSEKGERISLHFENVRDSIKQ